MYGAAAVATVPTPDAIVGAARYPSAPKYAASYGLAVLGLLITLFIKLSLTSPF